MAGQRAPRARSASAVSAEPGRAAHAPAPADDFAEPGQALEPNVRGFMEDRFGADFSGVRVHTSERDSGFAAYTYGNRIAFARQAYQPRTPDGIGLIAHELAHVMQQGRGGAAPGASSERAAGRAADLALQGRGSAGTVAGATALGVAGQSEEELARRRQEQAAGMLPRGVQYMLDPGRLDREYRAALAAARQTGAWEQAAEILNGFNHEDIQNRLAELSDAEVHYMHQGALANRKVGSDANVARLTRPGMPRASTPAPAPAAAAAAARRAAQGGAAGLTDDAVRAMSTMDRLAKAYELAPIGAAAAREIASLVTPRALVGALVGFVVVYGALQLTPVGWAANIGIALTAAFVGPTLFRALNGLVRFARAANATTVAELEEAGRHLADAIGGVGVQVILALVIRRTASNVRASGPPYNGPPPTGFADAVATNGMIVRAAVPVGASTVPARLAPAMAASLGLNAVPGTLAMMQSGGGSGSGPPSSGRGHPQAGRAQQLADEAVARGDKVVVNLGGAGAKHEPQGAINVNNQAVARRNIPNLVEADGSDIGRLFRPGSVDQIEGHNMAPGAIDWTRAAPGAHQVLKPGGRFQYYWRGANADAQACAQALRDAGFQKVTVISDVLVVAIR